MNAKNRKNIHVGQLKRNFLLGFMLLIIGTAGVLNFTAQAGEKLEITPNEKIELKLNRALSEGENRLAIFVGEPMCPHFCG